jgi:hypothetical protein
VYFLGLGGDFINSAASSRRSRCGYVRAWPVASSQGSLGWAPQVGHRTDFSCFVVSLDFTPNRMQQNQRQSLFNFDRQRVAEAKGGSWERADALNASLRQPHRRGLPLPGSRVSTLLFTNPSASCRLLISNAIVANIERRTRLTFSS